MVKPSKIQRFHWFPTCRLYWLRWLSLLHCRSKVQSAVLANARLAGIALSIVVECGWFRNSHAVVEIEVPSCSIERYMRRLIPEREAERLVAMVFLELVERAVRDKVIAIFVIGFLRTSLALAPFSKARVVIVGDRCVEAEIVIPVAVFQAIARMDFAEDGSFISGIVEQIGEDGNIGG